MRLRDQAHGQLRLGADGIETGRVQDHETLLQQRMRHVEHRMAPARDLHQAARIAAGVVVRRAVVPEPQPTRVVERHPQHIRHLRHRLHQLVGIVDVDRHVGPARGFLAPVHQGERFETRLDRQQPQTGWLRGVVAQLRRAHGRATGARRHDAATIAGEEDRVDEFRLAARELGNEGDHHLARAQLRLELAQAFGDRQVEQVVLAQPGGQLFEPSGDIATPDAVLVELLIERAAQVEM